MKEGTKFSKEQLDKLQQEFLDKNSTGYTFNGWYSDEKFSGDKITAENLAEISINEEKNFYGKMTLKQYTVTFETSGGSAIDVVKEVNHGVKITKPKDPTKTGLIFINWYREDAFQNKFDFATDTITADTTLYARFLTSNTPTDITLSANSIDENQAIGTVVGNLTTTDATAGDSFTYSLATGDGDDNNGDFTIDGNQLKSAKSFDFETKSSYKIRIKTTDATGLNFEKKFTVTINDIGWIISHKSDGSYYDDGGAFKEDVANNGNGRFIKTDKTDVNEAFGLGTTKLLVLDSTKKFVANPVKGTDFTVSNLPANLNLQLGRAGAAGTRIGIWLNGAAVSHANSDDTTFTITFNKSIFAEADRPASNDEIVDRTLTFNIDFVD